MISVLAASSTVVTELVRLIVEWAIPIGLTTLVVTRLWHLLAVVLNFRFSGNLVIPVTAILLEILVPVVT